MSVEWLVLRFFLTVSIMMSSTNVLSHIHSYLLAHTYIDSLFPPQGLSAEVHEEVEIKE